MSRKPTKPAPIKTPGSPYAVEHGCTCSPVGNNYGHGIDSREPQFVIAPDCQIHLTNGVIANDR